MNQADYEKMASKLDALAGNTRSKFEDEPPPHFDDIPPIGEQQKTARSQGGTDDASDEPDHHRNAPVPSDDCLYGLIGDVARAGSKDTEANPFAVAAAMLAYLGVAVGRGPYMPIGDDWNHARLFITQVGRSSRGRKGTAKKLMFRIDKAIKELREPLSPQVHIGGLSSREGLAFLIHDGFTEGKNEVPAIQDKRLLVVESEFANILHQSKRDGNTLSPALRDAWDGVSIRPATKTNRLWASNPHIGLLCDVTPSELLELMAARELTNGFANRFLFFWAESAKVVPFPKYTPDEVIQGIAGRLVKILEFAGADKFVERDVKRMEFSSEAKALYAKLYKGELRDRSAGERITALLDRRAPMLLRLAMLFALTDSTNVISGPHINAAMAWVRYWVDSVKFVFQSGADEVRAAKTSDTASKILTYLADKGQATRKQLTKDCFQGHSSKAMIDGALDDLLTGNPPQITVESEARQKGTPGTPTKIYKLAANCANSANYGVNTGFAGDFADLRTVRTVRTDPIDEFAPDDSSQEFAQFASSENGPQTRMNAHGSHNSHSSHGNLEKSDTEFF